MQIVFFGYGITQTSKIQDFRLANTPARGLTNRYYKDNSGIGALLFGIGAVNKINIFKNCSEILFWSTKVGHFALD